MEKILKPPRREEFVNEAQQLLWDEIERWLASYSDLRPIFYDCESDNANGRYHNYMVELLSNNKASFSIRLHLDLSKSEAIFRLGYWGNHFSKQEQKVGSFFSIILTKEMMCEDGEIVSDGLPDNLYVDKVISLLDDAVDGKIKVNVTRLGERPIRWFIYRWSDIGWIELGTVHRDYSLLDVIKQESREQLVFKRRIE